MGTIRIERGKDVVHFGVMSIPNRKKCALVKMRGTNVDVLAWFVDEDAAMKFQDMLDFVYEAERKGETMSKVDDYLPSENDSWARVELWRWQYGTLPGPDDMRPLDVAAGLSAMAVALSNPESDENPWPAPRNVAAVLHYVAKGMVLQHEQNR